MEHYIYKKTSVYKHRTTIPEEVRKELKIKDGDKLIWIKERGLITIKKQDGRAKTKEKFNRF